MATEPKPTLIDLFPLPEGVRIRERRFGANPVSSFVPVPVRDDKGDTSPQSAFKLSWEDREQGLTVIVKEQNNGHLIANVFSTDASLLNKAVVSVALSVRWAMRRSISRSRSMCPRRMAVAAQRILGF